MCHGHLCILRASHPFHFFDQSQDSHFRSVFFVFFCFSSWHSFDSICLFRCIHWLSNFTLLWPLNFIVFWAHPGILKPCTFSLWVFNLKASSAVTKFKKLFAISSCAGELPIGNWTLVAGLWQEHFLHWPMVSGVVTLFRQVPPFLARARVWCSMVHHGQHHHTNFVAFLRSVTLPLDHPKTDL